MLGQALIALKVIRELGLEAMVTLAPTRPDQTHVDEVRVRGGVPDPRPAEEAPDRRP